MGPQHNIGDKELKGVGTVRPRRDIKTSHFFYISIC